jgi:hypothetical protein
MRSVAAAALLLVATAASGGELIHFRAPDGRAGMVDHPSKLPPGAVVVERREKTERAEEPAPASEASPPARLDEEAAAARPGGLGGLRPSGAREDAAVCLRLGLPGDCSPGQVRGAEHWCERGESARRRVEEAEQALVLAEEERENCETAALRGGYCSENPLEIAEQELEAAERSLSGLEDACRSADCLPGWVRDGCER